MSRFTILGSANAVPKPGQENTHLLVQSENKLILIDCGDNPVAKLAAMDISITNVTDLILTHFHADHVGSLPLLVMDMWLEKRQDLLRIYGLEFTLERARKLLDVFDWSKWKNMFPVEFIPIGDESMEGFIIEKDLKVSALPVLHLVPTIGLRFDFIGENVVSYSCDTEPCENVERLADKADVHLQESAGESKGHTSAAQAGIIAARAGVKKLVLIHYESRIDHQQLIADAASNFQGEVQIATDMMRL